MKRLWLIVLTLLVTILGIITWVKLRPVEPEVSELYERCKDVPGIRVGFIKDFPVNDSVTCDVTTIEALTDEGWEWMLDSLGVRSTAEMDAFFDSIYLASGMSEEDCANTIDLWQSKRFHPEVQGDSNVLGNSVDCNLASPHYRWLTVYHATSDEELDAVINFHIKYQMEHSMTMMPTKDNTIKQQ